MFVDGYNLIHPVTGERVAIFQGYTETGQEMWLTSNGIECCKFEGFTEDGWTKWSQSIDAFCKVVE